MGFKPLRLYKTDVGVFKKMAKEKKPKTYTTNNVMFEDATKKALKFLASTKNKILDLGSDKDPKFALEIARKYEDSQITHFRDTKTMGRIDIRYKKENLNYVFIKRKLKRTSFDVATAFLTLHEFPNEDPEYEREEELKILHRCLKQNGKIVVIDYDLKWVQQENISEDDFIKEIFAEGNERKVMKTEWNCMNTHTSLGLEDYIEELRDVGFKKRYSGKYHIQTSWGIKPKFFLYIGEKV